MPAAKNRRRKDESMNYEIHPAANEFPMLDAKRHAELVADIATNGQRETIKLYQGTVLDGRNRLKACQELGLTPKTATLPDDTDPWSYVWSLNGTRRDLVDEQRYLIWKHCHEQSETYQAELAHIREEANRKRSEATKGRERAEDGTLIAKSKFYGCRTCGETFHIEGCGHCPKCDHHYPVGDTCHNCHEARIPNTMFEMDEPVVQQSVAPLDQPTPAPPKKEKHIAQQSKAAASKTNPGAVARGDKLAKERPDLAAAVRHGELKPAEAHRQMKKQEVAQKAAALPKGQYRVIYADPPWHYGDGRTGDLMTATGAQDHYPTMKLAELKALDVPSIAAPDSVLFLWATSPLLPDALELAQAWGFKYKASFIWDKVKHNLGHYNSVRHEFLLICTKGSATPDNVKLYDSVQSIERQKHSAKPEEFRAIIDELYTVGARIELFRRGDAVEGWEVWGNESAA